MSWNTEPPFHNNIMRGCYFCEQLVDEDGYHNTVVKGYTHCGTVHSANVGRKNIALQRVYFFMNKYV